MNWNNASIFFAAAIAGITVLPAPASAAEDGKGIYVVVRGGMSVKPDQKFDEADLPASTTFDQKTKYKSGVTGELGGGYDFGIFRLEQAGGYMSLDAKDLDDDGYFGEGRNKAMFVSLSAYIDIPLSRMVEPYVGGGAGIARVDATLSRTDDLSLTMSE